MLTRILPALFIGSLISGCSSLPTSMDIKPRQEPAYNFTQSSKVLACVGTKINKTQGPNIDVFIADIPDHTVPPFESSFLAKNTVMMVTTALDRLKTPKVAVIGQRGALKNRMQIQILGSFTELNRTTSSTALSGQTALPGGVDLKFGGDKNYNHIVLDMALTSNNRIVPGSPTSVGIQVRGGSGNTTITYDQGTEFAVVSALGFSAQEGFHAAQRLLIETSVAIIMAKAFEVDVKSCLQENKRKGSSTSDQEYDTPVFPEAEKEEKKDKPRVIKRRNERTAKLNNARTAAQDIKASQDNEPKINVNAKAKALSLDWNECELIEQSNGEKTLKCQ